MATRIQMPQSVFAIIMLTLILGSAFLTFAKDANGMDLLPQSKNIFFAILVAIVVGLGGYLKQAKPEDFDPVKFLLTVIISVFVGFLMYYQGLDYSSALVIVESFFANAGFAVVIETWLKAIIRQFSNTG